ncbi:PREDICTED: putative F-box protein At4g10190 [Camelina sativa]|uniref:F-box protein At4g10190 n=1 Tax=Camelina sativa TaxID=90675 RepID=A0ABM0Z308_CAMSA|nr:PREDICTED: putative F-box protein At4g10190 [Camelina sativa]
MLAEFKKRVKRQQQQRTKDFYVKMYLPEDLEVEILSKAPLASLARLRWTSKRWNALIKDILAKKQSQVIMLIGFRVCLVSVDLHGIHNSKVKVTSQFSLRDPLSSNSSEEVDIRNVFHCEGLLLCTTKESSRVVVWNPCSRETMWIQPRDTYKQNDYFALGKSSCNKYKILRVDQHNNLMPSLLEFEIYDFTSNSWRVVGETIDWFIPRWNGRGGVSVKGNTYWLASTQDNPREDFLLCFDFSLETFGSVSLPGNYLSHQVISLSVTREDQKLCLLTTQSGKVHDIDVWIATKIDKTQVSPENKTTIESLVAASWSKFLSLDLANLHQRFRFFNGMNFLVDQEKKVLLCSSMRGVSNTFLHVVGGGKYIQVAHNDAETIWSLVVSYVPSFVQVQPTMFLE